MAHLLGECSHRRPSLAHHLSLLNFVANQVALCLLLPALVGSALADKRVDTEGSGLRLASTYVEGNRVAVAKFRGEIQLRAKVVYGRLDGLGSGESEMQLQLDADSANRLPRPVSAERGYYSSFIITNPQEVAIALFGATALRKLMTGESPALQVDAIVVVSRLSYGTDCGLHYEAAAVSVAVAPAAPVTAVSRGAVPHC
jgi:hypothetical protein